MLEIFEKAGNIFFAKCLPGDMIPMLNFFIIIFIENNLVEQL